MPGNLANGHASRNAQRLMTFNIATFRGAQTLRPRCRRLANGTMFVKGTLPIIQAGPTYPVNWAH